MASKFTPKGTVINQWTLLEDAPQASKRVSVSCSCGRVYQRSPSYCKLKQKCAKCNPPPDMRRHGLSRTPTYRSWECMKQRCLNPNASNYHKYGARGVTVCERWLGEGGFIRFLEDMGERPPGTQLDKDKKGNGLLYSPETCCWLAVAENAHLVKR